jgi:TolA-binding protein
MPDAAIGLSDLLVRSGRADEARRLLDDFARNYPKDWAAIQSVLGSGSGGSVP